MDCKARNNFFYLRSSFANDCLYLGTNFAFLRSRFSLVALLHSQFAFQCFFMRRKMQIWPCKLRYDSTYFEPWTGVLPHPIDTGEGNDWT